MQPHLVFNNNNNFNQILIINKVQCHLLSLCINLILIIKISQKNVISLALIQVISNLIITSNN